jgi:hypothetical protein
MTPLRAHPAKLSLAAISLLVAGGTGRPAFAFEIAPHRAVYDLAYNGSNGRSDVVDVTGTMLFEWEDSCDGWSVTQRTAMSFSYQSGETVDFGWNVVTWESKDGLRYRFFVRNVENGEQTEEYRGEARLDGTGQAGTATYTLPEERSLDLPAGTLFPSAHTLELIRRIEAGETFFWATIFDGFDEKGLSDISAVVTTRLETEVGAPGRLPLLAAGPSSLITLAFFDRGDESTEPKHEQQLRLHHNGVAESITFDFGEFTVVGKLRDLKPLPPPC